MHCKQIKLGDVWRTCNKIRAAIFRTGLNLWDYFAPLDPNRDCLISESQFISVLSGQLRGTIGLSEQEIAELADYFRIQDGRIFYTQLCEVIHNSEAGEIRYGSRIWFNGGHLLCVSENLCSVFRNMK